MKAPSTVERGAAAETLACEHLRMHGLIVVARNLRCRAGEIDVVCRDGEVIVIVEVRQRGRDDFGGALGSVTWTKRRRLIRATRFHCLRRSDWSRRLLRFDVVAVQGRPGAQDIVWIKDAFRAT